MKLLLTGAENERCQKLADALAPAHSIRLSARTPLESGHEFVQCGLGHDASTNLLVRGMDGIVHWVADLPGEDVSSQIDAATRCTYNLLLAAFQEGVRRVVLLSTLALMAAYPDNLRVDPRWRPQPTAEPPTLTGQLAERVCREFARERKLAVTVLRLGDASPARVAEAVEAALADDSDWSIVHVEEVAA